MFKRMLVANRGEIALRIIRTCRKMGIATVAVYSEADERSLYVREADEAVLLGPAPSRESYLVKDRIIAAALKRGCEAIHPGYGFLSENASFAEMVVQSGLVFVGPDAASIAAMGDKIESKRLACKAGVPVLPGPAESISSEQEALTVAQDLGFPVLLKPAGGGGGKGMRIVYEKGALESSITACREEAATAFGDDRIFVERYFPNSRHVEVQVLADRFGHVVYLGERECSIQRRYQKIVEECPCPALDASARKRLGEMACALARGIGYVNAGTVEFLMDSEGGFHFLEMNTRLQVEHPVTEMVFSVDLVELQMQVAAGEPLSLRQEDLSLDGWAIEARICAEDPTRNFLPSTGMITRYDEPRGRNIRVDSGIAAGSLVSIYYDSLLAKVVAKGDTREEARCGLVQALNRYHIEGAATNLDFVNAVLNHPHFIDGKLSTGFISEHFDQGSINTVPPLERLHYMVVAAALVYHNRNNLVRRSLEPMVPTVGTLRLPSKVCRYVVKDNNRSFQVRLLQESRLNSWLLGVDNREYRVITPEFEFYRRRLLLKIGGQRQYFQIRYEDNFFWIAHCGIKRKLEVYTPKEWNLISFMPKPKEDVRQDVLAAPMPGLVVKIMVSEEERVYKGQDLVVIECMKMQTGASSPRDGVVVSVVVREGQAVETGDILVRFKRTNKQ